METNNNDHVWDDNYVAPTPQVAEVTQTSETVTTEAPVTTETVQAVETTPAIESAPVAEETKSEPVVTEKIVEKIIEKFPEFENEDAKALFEAFQKGNEDDIFKYLNDKRTDYNSMSDYDVVKAGLKRDNPDWTEKRLDLEFKTKYDIKAKKDTSHLDPDIDADEIQKIELFNEAVEQKQSLLELQAEEYRIKLNNAKKEIQLPKIEQATAEVNQTLTDDQIAEINRQWEEGVDAVIPTLTDLTLKVNGEEVKYSITDEEKVQLTAEMKDFSAVSYLTKRGWFDKDGNPNVKNIAEDVYRFNNMDKMLSSVATKTKNATTKDVVADIKNVDLTRNGTSVPLTKVDAGEAVWNY